MSFKTAIPHLETALAHAKAGNAAKAMHHIGHAMLNLRSMTSGAGGASKLPMGAPVGEGADPYGTPADGDENPMTGAQGTHQKMPPAVGSLRAKLAGMTGAKGGY